MGWALACDKGTAKNCPDSIKKLAKGFKDKGDLKKFAQTKEKDLPEKKVKESLTFTQFLDKEYDR